MPYEEKLNDEEKPDTRSAGSPFLVDPARGFEERPAEPPEERHPAKSAAFIGGAPPDAAAEEEEDFNGEEAVPVAVFRTEVIRLQEKCAYQMKMRDQAVARAEFSEQELRESKLATSR
jgi:hypothetical protein